MASKCLIRPRRAGSLEAGIAKPRPEDALMSTRAAGIDGESFQVDHAAATSPSSRQARRSRRCRRTWSSRRLKWFSPRLKQGPPNGLIVDLSQVNFFGSVFISFLLRCHLLVKKQGAELVLAGVSDRVRELLRLTSLDTLWALLRDPGGGTGSARRVGLER